MVLVCARREALVLCCKKKVSLDSWEKKPNKLGLKPDLKRKRRPRGLGPRKGLEGGDVYDDSK